LDVRVHGKKKGWGVIGKAAAASGAVGLAYLASALTQAGAIGQRAPVWWASLAEHMPVAVVMIITIVIFMRFIERSTEALRQVNKEALDAQVEMGRVLGRAVSVIERLERRLDFSESRPAPPK
jgi:hypothetical protein